MKLKIDKKQFQSITGVADQFSSLVKNGDTVDKTVRITASKDKVTMTVHAHSVSAGFSIDFPDVIDYTVEEEGSVVVHSSYLKVGVDSISHQTIVIEGDEQGISLSSDGDATEKVELDVPVDSFSEDVEWDSPPQPDEENSVLCGVDNLTSVLTASTPSGIPLYSFTVVIHPMDNTVIVGAAETNAYLISLHSLDIAEESTMLESDIPVHSDYIPVAMKALDTFAFGECQVRLSHDKESRNVVYELLDEHGEPYAIIWGATVSSSKELSFSMLQQVADSSISEDSAVITVDRNEFAKAAKSSTMVGKASGAIVDKVGNVNKTDPVKLTSSDGGITIQSIQKSSSYTKKIDAQGDFPDDLSLSVPFGLIDNYIKGNVFAQDTLKLVVTDHWDTNSKVKMVTIIDNNVEQPDIQDIITKSVIVVCSTAS